VQAQFGLYLAERCWVEEGREKAGVVLAAAWAAGEACRRLGLVGLWDPPQRKQDGLKKKGNVGTFKRYPFRSLFCPF